jgi:hypothetical protein
LEKQAYKGHREKPELKEIRAPPESKAQLAFGDHKAIPVYKVQRGIRAKRD